MMFPAFLGFIGPEDKALWRTLLANLTGDAAWRTPPVKACA
ncbi:MULTISPECIES: hypothetical protein [Auritidibacter]|nr:MULTISPECIES: hypothetical protein [Auritidibacter]NIH70450.1 hypothetical protein [Auritidibacter ignavus]WGH82282.1 hypothetical protein QDX25_03755 [Auritidibacter ignavus]WGH91478.1 hypothetical protein QDX23_03680 [Auritidibacter ignavus]WHS27808.1 hypothetical protein QM395_10645 [Auritidibacter ignavus]